MASSMQTKVQDIRSLSVPLNGSAVGVVALGVAGGVCGGAPLDREIARAGRRMEAAMAAGEREVAQCWMRLMYDLIRLRNRAVVRDDIEPMRAA